MVDFVKDFDISIIKCDLCTETAIGVIFNDVSGHSQEIIMDQTQAKKLREELGKYELHETSANH